MLGFPDVLADIAEIAVHQHEAGEDISDIAGARPTLLAKARG